MYKILVIIGVILVFGLAGCASTKEICQKTNWEDRGFRDGSNGLSENRYQFHEKRCAAHGIKGDFQAYKRGRVRGLETVYCQPRKGYQIGLAGKTGSGACPAHLTGKFEAALKYGLSINQLQQQANKEQNAIQHDERELQEMQIKLGELNHNLNNRRPPQEMLLQHIVKEEAELKERFTQLKSRIFQEKELATRHKMILNGIFSRLNLMGSTQAELKWSEAIITNPTSSNKRANERRRKIIRSKQEFFKKEEKRIGAPMNSPTIAKLYGEMKRLTPYMGKLAGQRRILKKIGLKTAYTKTQRFKEYQLLAQHHADAASYIKEDKKVLREMFENSDPIKISSQIKFIENKKVRLQRETVKNKHHYNQLAAKIQKMKTNSPYR